MPLECDRAHVRASWKTLLHDLPGPADCRAIVDRLEPEWYRGIADMTDVVKVAALMQQYPILDTMGMYPSGEDSA